MHTRRQNPFLFALILTGLLVALGACGSGGTTVSEISGGTPIIDFEGAPGDVFFDVLGTMGSCITEGQRQAALGDNLTSDGGIFEPSQEKNDFEKLGLKNVADDDGNHIAGGRDDWNIGFQDEQVCIDFCVFYVDGTDDERDAMLNSIHNNLNQWEDLTHDELDEICGQFV